MNIQEIRQKYPQYNDLSDEQLGQSLHAKFYADMPYEQFAAKVGLGASQAQPEPEQPGMLSRIGRQIGLTARAPAAAALAIPAIVGDVLTGGRSTPAVETVLDAVFPKPANATERIAQDVAGAMAGGGALAKATKTMQTALPQVLSAAGGAGGAGGAREAGFGPVGQLVAGVGGGVVAPSMAVAGMEGAKTAVRLGRGMAEPFTEEGRRNIVARAMQGNVKDREAALKSLNAAGEIVPGAAPTTAEAAQDAGLSALQKSVRNQSPADFADRAAAQDAARQAYLDRVFGQSVPGLEAERAAATSPMREAAFEAAGKKKIDTRPVVNAANSILKSGAGKRQEVEKAMEWVKSRLDGETNAQRLDAIRQDINDIIAGKMDRDPEKGAFKLAANELKAVRGRLVEAINAKAPLYKEYLKEYGAKSIPIEQQRLGQEIRAAATNPTTERLSTAGLTRQMAGKAEDIGSTMSAEQSDALYRLAQDMRRSAAPEAAMRAPGSDTLQNMVGANMLRTAGLSAAPARMAAGLMGRLYGPLESQTQGLMTQAMLDPQLGSAMLSRRIAQDPKAMEELLRRLLAVPGAGLLGAGVAQ